jgi:hypothetical protein
VRTALVASVANEIALQADEALLARATRWPRASSRWR